jgi:hypothetical protein
MSDISRTISGEPGGVKAPIYSAKSSKHAAVFFCQIILIFIVVITSIINLSLYHHSSSDSSSSLWIALLSSGLGYLLPNPSLKISKQGNNNSVENVNIN